MRVTWISGWGVAPESLRPLAEKYFEQSQHTFLAPTADAIETLFGVRGQAQRDPAFASEPSSHSKAPSPLCSVGAVQNAGAPDLTVAWSSGAWRLMEAASRGIEIPGMVLLFAPFVAFPAESGLGGKVSVTQVRFLHRWVRRDPLAALGDFYQRVRMMDAPTELPYALPDLLEGLDRLAEDAPPALREFAARGLPRSWQAFVGDDDPLLEAETVARSLPGCLQLRGVGHAIADLVRASQA